MTIPLITAVTGAAWEAELVAALDRSAHGITVVRRCVDLPDLLAAAATGTARAALVSGDLRRLDRDSLARLAASRVAVVGVAPPDDEDAERLLRQLGAGFVLPADAPAERVAATVQEAVAALDGGRGDARSGYADPLLALPGTADGDGSAAPTEPGGGEWADAQEGRLVAVWGPTGAPGRTTVAVTLADEVARLGLSVLLADADTYGGAVAQLLGLLDEAPGLAAAARACNHGTLDPATLARLATAVDSRLRVLTGISRADRWPELRPASLEAVWAQCRRLAAVTVVDCGFSLEQDEELVFDTAAPRRNGATLVTLESADVVVAVGAADPVGMQRLVRGLADLRETVPGASIRVVANRVRRGVFGGDPASGVREALSRHAGVVDPVLVPHDPAGCDAMLARGRTLADVAPDSPARPALAGLAAELAGVPAQRRRRRTLRRGRPG